MNAELEKWAYSKGRGVLFMSVPEEAEHWVRALFDEIDAETNKREGQKWCDGTPYTKDEACLRAVEELKRRFGIGTN